ncbi:MAG: diacylglycerol kinase family lipid kinase [bacterium]|nr:diacylglycerol kinase family lipid kinase [bacterium]
MKARIIANPISGGGRGKAEANKLVDALTEHGVEAELVITGGPGDAETAAAKPGADCVVAVGGDGSANEVANGLDGTDTAMAILPLGTANVVARELGIPGDAACVAGLIAAGNTRAIDVGRYQGRRFLQSAGSGFDAAVVRDVHAHRGRRLSFASYVMPVLRQVRSYGFPPIRVIVDDAVLCEDAQYAIVGNCPYSAGVLALTPRARIDDGFLDVCVFRNLNVLRLAYLMGTAVLGSIDKRAGVIYAKAKTIAFESVGGDAVPLQIDGDPAGEIPAALSVEPGGLRVIAP